LFSLPSLPLVLGLTVNKVLTSRRQFDPTVVARCRIILLPQSRKPAGVEPDQSGWPNSGRPAQEQWSLLFSVTPSAQISARTLAQLRQLQGQLPPGSRASCIVLVTVDPHRDTPDS
jgi:protein SCO1/2